ncbi:MAG TPA: dTDP-4-dehydrorhamnose reductase [Anaerolineales bacterium]|nr:dTDP-4-dehydrorhamnose reductase [Anaerolineales bacterium]
MKILLLGNTGQLGWELQRCLLPLGSVTAFDFPDVDMADAGGIRAKLQECRPDVVINATAYTAVDKAESEPALAEKINGFAPGVLAEEARKLKALLIHYSTDYIFNGKKGSPYIESDLPDPLSVYGTSKLHGEQSIQQVGGDYLILRTSWVYSLRQGGFVNKVLDWSHRQQTLRMVSDQVGNPTWCRMLAEGTVVLLARGDAYVRERTGLYHLAGCGFASRYDWAKLILELDPNKSEQTVKELLPALTSEFPTPAQRPLFSALDCSRFLATFGLELPDWRVALRLALG